MPEIRNFILQDKDGNETSVDIVSKTDATLSQENMPADAKSLGEKITEINQRITNIQVETGQKEIFNHPTHFDFPSIGSVDCIYKAYKEKKTYQWNEELLIYEPLNEGGSMPEITIINGGNANGIDY